MPPDRPHETPDPAQSEQTADTGQQSAPNLIAMGQLAAGIAHEINTPAQYVSDNLHFLQDAFDGFFKVFTHYQDLYQSIHTGSVKMKTVKALEAAIDDADMDYLLEQVPDAIGQSLEGMSRITQIVQAMRDFSHPGLMEKKTVDMGKAIQNTVMVTRNIWKYVSDIETDLDDTLTRVPCRPGEINQVILNLIVNAADAIAETVGDGTRKKGTIRIRTRRVEKWAEIRISDTGPGIPVHIQEQIFTPFFTTKPVGKGTGQGLAIAARVIANHGGALNFETRQGAGTTFIIRLPLENKDA